PEGPGAAPAAEPPGRRGPHRRRLRAPLPAAQPACRRGPAGGAARRGDRAAAAPTPADPAVPRGGRAAAGGQATPVGDQAQPAATRRRVSVGLTAGDATRS